MPTISPPDTLIYALSDMSFFNTQRAIEQRLTSTFANCRRKFFEAVSNSIHLGVAPRPHCLLQFGDNMEDITTPEKRHTFSDVKDVFQRVCHDPSAKHKLLASAYYRVAYGKLRRLQVFSPRL